MTSSWILVTRTRMVAGLGRSAHSHIVRLTHSRRKWSKSINDTSAVALWKEGDWQEREPVTNECHDRTGKPDERSDEKLGQNSSKRQSSDARQLGCVFQDATPPKSVLRRSTDMSKPIQRVKFTKAIARHIEIRDQNPSLGSFVQVNLMSVAPTIVHKKRQSGKSKVPAKQRGSWPKMCLNQRSTKEQHSSRLRKMGASLHQRWNLRKESLLWTPVRQCTWPAKRTWAKLEWTFWRSRVVLR